MLYFQLLKALNYNSTVLDQDSDHEVSGLRPVYSRIYKRLAGHDNWRRDLPRHERRRRMWVMRRKKVVNEDGTTAVLEAPLVVEVQQAHLHDEIISGPQMEQIRSSEALVAADGQLPLPDVMSRTNGEV